MIKYNDETTDVAVLLNGTTSASFKHEGWVSFWGALFPAMSNGAIGIEMSLDNSNFYPVLDIADGDDAVLCASGADPGFVDFSDMVRFLPDGAWMRFTCAAQAAGAVTITVFKRG